MATATTTLVLVVCFPFFCAVATWTLHSQMSLWCMAVVGLVPPFVLLSGEVYTVKCQSGAWQCLVSSVLEYVCTWWCYLEGEGNLDEAPIGNSM